MLAPSVGLLCAQRAKKRRKKKGKVIFVVLCARSCVASVVVVRSLGMRGYLKLITSSKKKSYLEVGSHWALDVQQTAAQEKNNNNVITAALTQRHSPVDDVHQNNYAHIDLPRPPRRMDSLLDRRANVCVLLPHSPRSGRCNSSSIYAI